MRGCSICPSSADSNVAGLCIAHRPGIRNCYLCILLLVDLPGAYPGCCRTFPWRVHHTHVVFTITDLLVVQELGAGVGELLECSFYCDFLHNAVSAELASGCGPSSTCEEQTWPTFFALQPASKSICLGEAQYALFTSCAVSSEQADSFASGVSKFLLGASRECNPTVGTVAGTGVAASAASGKECLKR
jgi:hypothetical protein